MKTLDVRITVLVCAVAVCAALILSRPTPEHFYRSVWIPARDGVRADIQHNRDTSSTYQLLKVSPLSGRLLSGLEALKDAELNRLPDLWMQHTRVSDWLIAREFLYAEATCSSRYVGLGGLVVNVSDGCEVEHFRKAGL